MQIAFEQACPRQLRPQAPQLLPSVAGFTQAPSHSSIAGLQASAPPAPVVAELVAALVAEPPAPLLVELPAPLPDEVPSKFQSNATQLAVIEMKRSPMELSQVRFIRRFPMSIEERLIDHPRVARNLQREEAAPGRRRARGYQASSRAVSPLSAALKRCFPNGRTRVNSGPLLHVAGDLVRPTMEIYSNAPTPSARERTGIEAEVST